MISVVLPTRNPHPERLRQTLAGLAAQTILPREREILIVDNGSSPPLTLPDSAPPDTRIVTESTPGLTSARLCGIREARGDTIVFVDDDNVLDPAFLTTASAHFDQYPRLGTAGGPVRPVWEEPPPAWSTEFHGLLALRDLGNITQFARGGIGVPWPSLAPVGAGLCVRRAAAELYAAQLSATPARRQLDRMGRSLASGGDSDLVFTALHGGWDTAYFPDLRLTHLIPSSRLTPAYLARLNEGIMRSWVRVLALHGQCPWPPIPRWTVHLRALRAWFRFQAWRTPSHHIRWRGAVGQFQGQADLVAMSGVHGSAAR